MRIYNYTVYDNFLREKREVCFKGTVMDLVPEFETAEMALEENGRLSYGLFIGTRPAGRLLFPWMKGWEYRAIILTRMI
jgi:hypothetical protein